MTFNDFGPFTPVFVPSKERKYRAPSIRLSLHGVLEVDVTSADIHRARACRDAGHEDRNPITVALSRLYGSKRWQADYDFVTAREGRDVYRPSRAVTKS